MITLLETSVQTIKQALSEGTVTSEELVLFYMKRIATIDQGDPKYNSILEVNPNALFEAKRKDIERKNNISTGLLHGIPVVVKDNINTTGLMHTTAGSLALKHHYAKEDATIISRLKEEGAILLGKANLTEFANFMSYNMRNGYSSLGGEVLCPYNLEQDPSGSSAGSAVSVALNLVPLAVGTETGGSIMSPAMKNGIVGLKPSIGLISRNGIVPISSTLDTAGPMAKTVDDVAILLTVLQSLDSKDEATHLYPHENKNFYTNLDQSSLKKARIAVDMTKFDTLSNKTQSIIKETLSLLEKQAVTLINDLPIKQTGHIFDIMKYEFKQNINKYLANEQTRVQSLEEIIKYNQQYHKEALHYGQQLLEDCLYQTSGHCNETEYINALDERLNAQKQLRNLFESHNLDVIYFVSYTSLGPHCGFPTLTLPIGYDDNNIPIGMYLLANEHQEQTLLNIAKGIENITKKRKNPLKEA